MKLDVGRKRLSLEVAPGAYIVPIMGHRLKMLLWVLLLLI